jgi:hypothetical protein
MMMTMKMVMVMMMMKLHSLSVIGEILHEIRIVGTNLEPMLSISHPKEILKIHFNVTIFIFEVLTFQEG